MASLFSGLNTARSGLMASQTALDITSQNISNASTDGYSRQTLNITAIGPDSGTYRFARSGAAVGYGVNYDSVTQSRNQFLDVRYRDANSKYNTWNTQSSEMTSVENIFQEFSTDSDNTLKGLSGSLSNLVGALSTYQQTPTSTTMDATIMTDADMLNSTIHKDYTDLVDLENQEKGDLSIIIDGNKTGGGINGILDSITSLNSQIASYEVSGQNANDLRDQRNTLLDQLSGYLDINVSEQENGMVTVGLQNGGTSHMLIDENNKAGYLKLNDTKTAVLWSSDDTTANIQGGSVDGYLKVLNGDGSGQGQYGNIGIPYMLTKLNDFAKNYADMMNNIATNTTTNGGNSSAVALITGTTADTIAISKEWQAKSSVFSQNYKGASLGDFLGQYVTAFSKNNGTVQYTSTVTGTPTTEVYNGSLQDFADSFTGDLASAVSKIKTSASDASDYVDNLDSQRQAISSVSIDEESINIIKYQQSYSASARVISTINDMLNSLISMVS